MRSVLFALLCGFVVSNLIASQAAAENSISINFKILDHDPLASIWEGDLLFIQSGELTSAADVIPSSVYCDSSEMDFKPNSGQFEIEFRENSSGPKYEAILKTAQGDPGATVELFCFNTESAITIEDLRSTFNGIIDFQ